MKFFKVLFVVVIASIFSGGALCVGANAPELRRINDPNIMRRLVPEVTGRIGRDFVLDRFLKNVSTLEDGFKYIFTEAHPGPVPETMSQWPTVYGTEFTNDNVNRKLRVFVFSGTPDFSGDLVYAVLEGFPQGVYLYGR